MYEVLGASALQTRLDIGIARGLTPFVGRAAELAMLRDRWAYVQEGTGQVVLLRGEAGIGKSRLVQVPCKTTWRRTAAWLTPVAVPPTISTPPYPVIALLERVALRCNRRSRPGPTSSRPGGASWCSYRSAPGRGVPLLAGLSSPCRCRRALCAAGEYIEQQKQRTLRPVDDPGGGPGGPAAPALFMEDLHWADPSTLDLLSRFVGRSHGAHPGGVDLSADFEPPWTGAYVDHPRHAPSPAASPDRRHDQAGGAWQGARPRGRGAGGGRRPTGCPCLWKS